MQKKVENIISKKQAEMQKKVAKRAENNISKKKACKKTTKTLLRFY